MKAVDALDHSRSPSYRRVLAAWTLAAFVATPAVASIRSVHVETTSWNPFAITVKDRTPLFRGDNTLRVVGTDPGITLATRFELRSGTCPTTSAAGSLVAVGSIKSASVRDYAGLSSVILNLPLTQTQALGSFCGHLVYPTGNRDTFTTVVYSRGLVSAVTSADADGFITGGSPVVFTWTGAGMNPASINTSITPLAGVTSGPVAVVGGTAGSSAALTFAHCGEHRIYSSLLFGTGAPAALVADVRYRYRGSSFATVTVSGNCTPKPPSTTPAQWTWSCDDPRTTVNECTS